MDTVKWEELDLRVSTTIYTSLAKNVLGTSSIKELWEKLEGLYLSKCISAVIEEVLSLLM
jgi:hypothetical protein